jgi:methyltransferase
VRAERHRDEWVAGALRNAHYGIRMAAPPGWYVAILAAVGAQRVAELALSRANEEGRGGTRAARRTFPLMVAAHVGLLTLPLVEASVRGTRTPRWGWLGVLGAATALRVWSIRSLGTAWNVRAAVPDDLEPVQTGPYRFVRHPNYAAVIIEFAAIPMLAGAWVSAVALSALNAAVLYDRIRDEERLLDSSAAYRRAFAHRARFIPRVF